MGATERNANVFGFGDGIFLGISVRTSTRLRSAHRGQRPTPYQCSCSRALAQRSQLDQCTTPVVPQLIQHALSQYVREESHSIPVRRQIVP